MKMDAAEPFNVPVNPEALGIPVSTTMFMLIFPWNFFVQIALMLCLGPLMFLLLDVIKLL